MASVVGLVAEVHHESLAALTKSLGRHCVGLSVAGRSAYRAGLISSAMSKKLARLDAASHIVRHITSESSHDFLHELASMLHGGLPKPTRMCFILGMNQRNLTSRTSRKSLNMSKMEVLGMGKNADNKAGKLPTTNAKSKRFQLSLK